MTVSYRDAFNRMSRDEQEAIDAIVEMTINGCYGNGIERKQRLGELYTIVQSRINEKMMAVTMKRESIFAKALNAVRMHIR